MVFNNLILIRIKLFAALPGQQKRFFVDTSSQLIQAENSIVRKNKITNMEELLDQSTKFSNI